MAEEPNSTQRIHAKIGCRILIRPKISHGIQAPTVRVEFRLYPSAPAVQTYRLLGFGGLAGGLAGGLGCQLDSSDLGIDGGVILIGLANMIEPRPVIPPVAQLMKLAK